LVRSRTTGYHSAVVSHAVRKEVGMVQSRNRTRRVGVSACALLVAALAAALLVSGCGTSGKVVSASGHPVTKQFDLGSFTAVRLDNAVQAAVVYDASATTVAVTVDHNLVEYLVVEVEGDTLHIGLQPGNTYSGQTFRATVVMPRLSGIEQTGAARGRVIGFVSSDPLWVRLSGGSRAGFSGIEAGAVTFDVSGASGLAGGLSGDAFSGMVSGTSRVGVTGTAGSARLEASGASSLDLGALTIGDLEVRLSGGSRGTVTVNGTLDADVSGGSTLEYGGSPTLGDVQASGGSQIRRTGE